MRWLMLIAVAMLAGCPTPTTPGTDAAPLDAGGDAGVPFLDAEVGPDAEAVDTGLVMLRGALRPAAQEARGPQARLRGHLSVTTTTRARSRAHVIEGGLGPLGY